MKFFRRLRFKMFSFVFLISFVFLTPCALVVSAESNMVDVSAVSAILMTADTKQVLSEKNAKQQMPMASTTKIMTALIALEICEADGDPVLTMTDEMVTVEGSSMGLRAGYRLRLSELAAGMLLPSGNDAANATAIAISGSIETFADKMNTRASEIGMNDSNFVTPSGLGADGHYSTAYDMALLAAEAMKNQRFRELSATKSMIVQLEDSDDQLYLKNHNKMLSIYDGCIGLKTGFTKEAGRCLVSAAERGGTTLIAVTLKAPDDWNDHTRMLDYGFSQCVNVTQDDAQSSFTIPVVGGMKDEILVGASLTEQVNFTVLKADYERVVRQVLLPKFLYAAAWEKRAVGIIQYELDGKIVAQVPLVLKETVEYSKLKIQSETLPSSSNIIS